MKRIAILAVTFLLTADLTGWPQRKSTVYGQGNQSCGEWTEKNKGQRDPLLYTWVVGFVSGAGYSSPRTQKETDSSGIAVWMDTYCAAHPLEAIAKAAGVLVTELESTNLSPDSN